MLTPLVLGQRPREGTKSCRMVRSSVCPTGRPYVPSLAGPQTPPTAPKTTLYGPQTPLTAPQTPLSDPQSPPACIDPFWTSDPSSWPSDPSTAPVGPRTPPASPPTLHPVLIPLWLALKSSGWPPNRICYSSFYKYYPPLSCTEIQKSVQFRERATGGRREQQTRIWNLSRTVFAFEYVSFLLSLLSLTFFNVYWLIIDSEAVFFFETAHYFNTFFIFVVSLYFLMQKFGVLAKIVNLVCT